MVGDIHGMSEELNGLLHYWNPRFEQLVLIGDYIDRGYNSLAVLERVWQLEANHQAICLRGNHESMLLNFIKSPHNFFNHYVMNGGISTLCQLLDCSEDKIIKSQARKIVRQLRQEYPCLEAWLESLPYYIEFGEFIVVHAGIDLSLENWKDTSDHDYLWLRDRFHREKNQTGKQIIFGHTPTMVLHQNYHQSSVWRQDGKWGIDGGLVFGGQLHGLRINKTIVEDIFSTAIEEGDN